MSSLYNFIIVKIDSNSIELSINNLNGSSDKVPFIIDNFPSQKEHILL